MVRLKKRPIGCMCCEFNCDTVAPNLINKEILDDIEEDCDFCRYTKILIRDTESRLEKIKEKASKDARICIELNDKKMYGKIEEVSHDCFLYVINKHQEVSHSWMYTDRVPEIYYVPELVFPTQVKILLDKGLSEITIPALDLEFTDNRFTKFELEYLSNLIVNDNGYRTLLRKIDDMIKEM